MIWLSTRINDQVAQPPVYEVNKDNDNDEDDGNQWLSMIINDQVAHLPFYEVNNDNNNVDDDAGDKGFVDYDNDDSGGVVMGLWRW